MPEAFASSRKESSSLVSVGSQSLRPGCLTSSHAQGISIRTIEEPTLLASVSCCGMVAGR